jgi:hypothetical protein
MFDEFYSQSTDGEVPEDEKAIQVEMAEEGRELDSPNLAADDVNAIGYFLTDKSLAYPKARGRPMELDVTTSDLVPPPIGYKVDGLSRTRGSFRYVSAQGCASRHMHIIISPAAAWARVHARLAPPYHTGSSTGNIGLFLSLFCSMVACERDMDVPSLLSSTHWCCLLCCGRV